MRMIFVNLPVKSVEKSTAFFGKLGFERNAAYSDESCSCLVIDENIYVMLLAESRFEDFINDRISDTSVGTEVLNCLSAGSREEVDDLLARALAAGGRPWKPVMEEGPMYGASFQDLDGHVWELVHMAQ